MINNKNIKSIGSALDAMMRCDLTKKEIQGVLKVIEVLVHDEIKKQELMEDAVNELLGQVEMIAKHETDANENVEHYLKERARYAHQAYLDQKEGCFPF